MMLSVITLVTSLLQQFLKCNEGKINWVEGFWIIKSYSFDKLGLVQL